MEELKIRFFCEARAQNMPQGMIRECFGICEEVCFVVLRPTGQTNECGEPGPDWNLSETMVFMSKQERAEDFLVGPGKVKDIHFVPLKVLSVKIGEKVPLREGTTIPEERKDYPDRTLFITTKEDSFYLPDPFVRPAGNGHVPTLNGKALSYYYS
jgi:hypothetical protein